jgi:hypothetical protein
VNPATHNGERRRSRARLGILVLLVASEALGLLLGQWFFRIYQQTVPPAVVTSFNVTAAHGWFLTNGALAGLLFFIWGLLVMWLAPLFRNRHAGAASREA